MHLMNGATILYIDRWSFWGIILLWGTVTMGDRLWQIGLSQTGPCGKLDYDIAD